MQMSLTTFSSRNILVVLQSTVRARWWVHPLTPVFNFSVSSLFVSCDLHAIVFSGAFRIIKFSSHLHIALCFWSSLKFSRSLDCSSPLHQENDYHVPRCNFTRNALVMAKINTPHLLTHIFKEVCWIFHEYRASSETAELDCASIEVFFFPRPLFDIWTRSPAELF